MSPRRTMAYLRVLPLAVTFALAGTPGHAQESGQQNTDLVGTWTLTKVLDSSEISSIDDAQAEALVGKTLDINPQKVTLAGESCRRVPTFARHYEDAAQFIRESAHAPVGRLGIPSDVEVVDLACTQAFIKALSALSVESEGTDEV